MSSMLQGLGRWDRPELNSDERKMHAEQNTPLLHEKGTTCAVLVWIMIIGICQSLLSYLRQVGFLRWSCKQKGKFSSGVKHITCKSLVEGCKCSCGGRRQGNLPSPSAAAVRAESTEPQTLWVQLPSWSNQQNLLFQVLESVLKYTGNYPMSNFARYEKNCIKIDFASV